LSHRQVLFDFFYKYAESPPKESNDLVIRTQQWITSIEELLFEIEDFRWEVVTDEINNRFDIIHHKIRLFTVLGQIRILRDLLNSLETTEQKDNFDRWISELREWCREGNENRLPADSSVKKEDGS
jgi:hypothetical protein